MARYELAARTVSGTAATAAAELRTTSSEKPRLLEISMFATAATATVMGLGVPAALGIGPSGAVVLQPDETTDPAAATQLAVNWSTAGPTAPTAFYRRLGMPAAAGAGLILVFPRGLTIAKSSSLVFWNIGTNPLIDLHAAIGE